MRMCLQGAPRLWLALACLALSAAVTAQDAPATASSTAMPPLAIPLAKAHAAAPHEASAPDAWGGVRTGNEPTLSDRVASYRIDAELDAARHSVKGSEQLSWRNRSQHPVNRIYLHLYLNAFQNEGSTFFTERSVFASHGHSRAETTPAKGEWGWINLTSVQQGNAALKWSFVHPDDGPATDQTVAAIDLAEPVPAGGTLTLDIDFVSQLPRVIERTGWWGNFNLVAQWFPKIGVLELPGERGATQAQWNVHEFHFNSEFYADFGSYDVRLDVPSDYTVGAVGQLQGEPQTANGRTTYHYVQGDVHDFAWVAAKGYKTLDGTYTGAGSPQVDVRVIYPREYVASAEPTLKSTIASLGYFSQTIAPYPYRTVTAVIPPYNADEAGGMEYPTFFTSEGYKEVKPGTIDEYMSDFVNIHEFGHGYFYGILASNEFEEPMLDEGMNEFWDDRMMRARNEDLVLASPFMKWLGITPAMSGFQMERLGAELRRPEDPLAQNSWDRLSSSSYGTVYTRTATAMHDLEQRIGEPAMEKAMSLYYQRWKFRHPSVADLRQALVDGSGDTKAVNEIFDQVVYGTRHIDDRVADIDTYEVLPQAGVSWKDGKPVEADQKALDKQIAKRRADWKKTHPDAKPDSGGPFPWHSTVTVLRDGAQVPETLRVTFADGSHEDVRWNDDRRWARFDFEKPGKVVSAELDPAQQAYLDANKLNDSYATKPNGAASRRWTADVAALLQTFYSMLVTL